ncbi:MAG: small redox-active disulfide protein 2 [Motiliproteus sp.]|jgi:small redox-active disulfide protein 2
MNNIQVLGSGCAKCIKTAQRIDDIIAEQGIEGDITKVSDPETIMNYGVMQTPAVVLNGVVVHTGSIPHRDQIISWFG